MRALRHKKVWRVGAIAVVLVVALFAFLKWRDRGQEYVPGEETEGLVDTLARGIPENHPKVRFVDVTEESGLSMEHFPGTRTMRLPEDMGSGVALGDYDGDGWTDVFVVGVAGPIPEAENWPRERGRSRLFKNLGGRFEDVTRQAGLDLVEIGMAAAFVDFDSDADLDLVTTGWPRLRLFRNDGGLFVDISEQAGVADREGFWSGIAAGDYDRDGKVDLYVCGYVHWLDEQGAAAKLASQFGVDIPRSINPSAFEAQPNLLLRNLGDGRFEDVALQAGVANSTGRSLGALFADLNGDGWVDLYVANDVSDNALFVNEGDGSFSDHTTRAQVGDYRGAMGMSVADFDTDGDLDLFITHWVAQENALYVNYPPAEDAQSTGAAPPLFFDEADRYGLGQSALSMVAWATRFFDYDNDGRLDLFVVNGSTIPLRDETTRLTPMRSQLYWNSGERRGYYDVGAVSGDFFRGEHVGRGGASFDYDLDGDEDLVVLLHGEGPRLLRNEGGNERSVLRLVLRQETGNCFALGAFVRLQANGQSFVDQIGTQGSYLSQHAVGEVAFGLGPASEVQSIEVVWPDGQREQAGPFPADARVRWTRGREPRVEPLPGKAERARSGPADAQAKRRFFELRDRAGEARLAGDHEAAVRHYDEALSIWPGHADCLYYKGNSLLELGEEEQALACLEWLVALHPASSNGWMQIGVLRLPGGQGAIDDLEAAEAAFRRSHDLNREESGPVVKLGLTALLRGDLERAETWFTDAIVLNSRSVEALYLKGLAAWRRGDAQGATELLERAHAVASEGGLGGHSVSAEGQTRGGVAMTAERLPSDEAWNRWRTLTERPVDAALEYGPR